MANGTARLQASSGRTVRHRLNRGGNRQLNRAIHTAALAQIAHPDSQADVCTTATPPAGKPTEKPAAASNGESLTASGPTSNTTQPRLK